MSLYIDPGTGSMLFTVILSLATAGLFAVRGVYSKVKLYVAKGKKAKTGGETKKYRYVIYTDSKRYWNVFKPLCDEFERRGIALHYMTQSEDDPFFKTSYKHITGEYIGNTNSAFAKLYFLDADTVISTTPSLDVYQWKRSKNVNRYVHVFHDVSDCTAYEMFGIDHYDDIIMTGKVQEKYIREMERMRNLKPKNLYLCGSVYVDDMVNKRKTYGEIKRESDKPTILLAPSWGKSSILNRMGEKMLGALVATDYNIVVRPHPQTKKSEPKLLDRLMAKFPEKENFHWDYSNDNFLTLAKSDLMITDYSSITCDYAFVFDRPFLYADADIDLGVYDSYWFKETTYRFRMVSKLGKQITEDQLDGLKYIIDDVMNNDKYAEGREEVKKEIWAYQGEAVKRTVDCIVGNKADA